MAFLIIPNSGIVKKKKKVISFKGKIGESRQKRGKIVLQDRVPVSRQTLGASGRNLGNGVSR